MVVAVVVVEMDMLDKVILVPMVEEAVEEMEVEVHSVTQITQVLTLEVVAVVLHRVILHNLTTVLEMVGQDLLLLITKPNYDF